MLQEKKKKVVSRQIFESRLGEKNNFLPPQLPLVHCPSKSWNDYGSSPLIALFWPRSSEEKEYPPGKWQFHKNVGSPPGSESPNLHRCWAHSLYNTGSNLGNQPVPLHLSDHCAALNTETFLQQSPIMDYTGTASLICCPSLWGFCLYNQAVREKLKNQSTSNPIFSCLLRLQSTPLQICKKN